MPFDQIWGQNTALTVLRTALVKNRLAHAYIFAGPEGIGKRQTALMLAKAMNCQSPPMPGDCCEHCPPCVKINSENHADVMLLEPDGELIKIDQIRDLQKRLRYRPMEGGRRICILDPADSMNEAASNALLKTLEEPPEETHLFLITCRPHRLLPTIQSRCQWVKFKALSSGEIIRILEEKHKVDRDKASFYTSLAAGSAGRAVAMSDTVDMQTRLEWLRLFGRVAGDPKADIWDICEKMAKEDDLPERLDLWKVWLRDLCVYKIHGRGLINHDLKEEIAAEAGKVSLDRIDFLFGLVSDVQKSLPLNVNRQLALENLFLAIRGGSATQFSAQG
jgi:DNA polymerase-3 subunit delta'